LKMDLSDSRNVPSSSSTSAAPMAMASRVKYLGFAVKGTAEACLKKACGGAKWEGTWEKLMETIQKCWDNFGKNNSLDFVQQKFDSGYCPSDEFTDEDCVSSDGAEEFED